MKEGGSLDNFECGNLTGKEIISYSSTGDPEVLTDSNPFSFTFTKSGYKPLVKDNIIVDKPLDWVVELQPYEGTGAQSRLISIGVM